VTGKNTHLHDSVRLTSAKIIYGTYDDKEMETWADNLELISSILHTDFKEWKRAGLKGLEECCTAELITI
jgi:hypothetical protein